MSQTVYVLKQEQGKSYVGISGNFNSRLDQHQFGEGAEWTKKYPVTGVESTETVANLQMAKDRERHLTLKLMKERGINNVRGGGYTQSMDYDDTGTIKQTVNNYYKESVKPPQQIMQQQKQVTCYKCGQTGHYANTCSGGTRAVQEVQYSKQIVCYKCGKSGHYASNCYSKNQSNYAYSNSNSYYSEDDDSD